MGVEMEIFTKQEKNSLDVMKAINIVLVIFVVILAFILISMSFLWTPMTVAGPSMEQTFHNGDHIILLTSLYKISYGDIIVFEKIEEEKNVIKRVIALEGEYIRFDQVEQKWYRNDVALDEPYVTCSYTITYFSGTSTILKEKICSKQGYLVEEGKIFVLGDNRINSNDSHVYGAIDQSQIKGKFLFRY